MGLISTLRAGLVTEERAGLVSLVETMGRDPIEPIEADYKSFVQRGFKDNGIIYACIAARLTLFAQGRLEMRNKRDGATKELPPRLASLVNSPWPNGSESELLARIEQDTSLAGNYYLYQAERGLWQRLRPDWVDIILDPIGRELAGYVYHQGGRQMRNPKIILPEEMAHGSPIPDPLAAFRGMSWMTTVTREVMGDQAMNQHKLKFFERAATPNLIIKFLETLSDPNRQRLQDTLRSKHAGIGNAYESLILEQGGDATVVGANMQQVSFDVVQAAGENRVAVAAGVPSVVLGIKEGAAQATYNNYGQALQHFSNFTVQHLWTHAASTLETLVPVPQGMELVYATDHIVALQRDQKDDAEIAEIQAVTIREYIDAGFTHESAIKAVDEQDVTLLVKDEEVVPEALQAVTENVADENDSLSFLTA